MIIHQIEMVKVEEETLEVEEEVTLEIEETLHLIHLGLEVDQEDKKS